MWQSGVFEVVLKFAEAFGDIGPRGTVATHFFRIDGAVGSPGSCAEGAEVKEGFQGRFEICAIAFVDNLDFCFLLCIVKKDISLRNKQIDCLPCLLHSSTCLYGLQKVNKAHKPIAKAGQCL